MKNKEEPSDHFRRGNPPVQVDLQFPDDDGNGTTDSAVRPDQAAEARAEQPALRDSRESETLMEQIADEANMEAAFQNVRRNRGAPGPMVKRSASFWRTSATAGLRFGNNCSMEPTSLHRFVGNPSPSPMAESDYSVSQTCRTA